MSLEFCEKCGSRMVATREGFLCIKCGKAIASEVMMQPNEVKRRNHSDSLVYVSGEIEEGYEKVSKECPKCGNTEALNWFSGVSGEHAGIRQERTVKHFRCTKCLHSWAESV